MQEAVRTGKQPTYFVADLANAGILKPWVVERMKKDNAEVLAGKIAFTPHSFCMPAGVPGYHLYGFQPLYFVQTPKEVVMIYSNDQQVRHVYLDVAHSAGLKPSWYGESVGHYEGDTLVVDTIGLNDKTFVDNFRTPHTEKLHVVERFKAGRRRQGDAGRHHVRGPRRLQRAMVGDAALQPHPAADGRVGLRGEQRAVLQDPRGGQAGFLKHVLHGRPPLGVVAPREPWVAAKSGHSGRPALRKPSA